MKVYLAGPMTGYPDHNFPAFHAAAKHLRSLGYVVVSPAELSGEMDLDTGKPTQGTPAFSTKYYMAVSLQELEKCDAMVVLKGFTASEGTQTEIAHAIEHGIRRYYYPRDVDLIPKPEVK